jgi:hypothetical protein
MLRQEYQGGGYEEDEDEEDCEDEGGERWRR